jgi:UDP-2,4-diacetamido-2,4,6-trideoxy-beta-L-altropyranose hydrolase
VKIKIFTEFGHGIGLGHVTRMTALADYLIQNSDSCDLVKFNPANLESNWIENNSYRGDLKSYDAIVVDSYLCPSEVYSEIAIQNHNTIAIDDYNRIKYPVRCLINPNVYFYDINYNNQTCDCFGGSEYIILRETFRRKLISREIKGRIVVTLGGSDYRNLFSNLVSLGREFSDIRFIIPESEKLEKLRSDFPQITFKGLLDEFAFWEELSQAEIIISACGQTLHECASLNKKTIGLCIDTDQKKNRNYYLNIGFLYKAYDWNDENLLAYLIDDCKYLLENSNSYFKQNANLFNPAKNLEQYREILLNRK